MENSLATINNLMIEVFNDILIIEEAALKSGYFRDVSITEVHTIEAIGLYTKQTMGEVAKKLNITVGTLTVAIKNLVTKDYVQRFSSEDDRRVVKVGLTKKGKVLYRIHEKFHKDMIHASITGLGEKEVQILAHSLGNLHRFLVMKYNI